MASSSDRLVKSMPILLNPENFSISNSMSTGTGLYSLAILLLSIVSLYKKFFLSLSKLLFSLRMLLFAYAFDLQIRIEYQQSE